MFHWRMSSLRAFWILVWYYDLQCKIWGKSDQLLLRYSTFNNLRSSFIGSYLHFKYFWFWFGPLSLSLNVNENPIRGCWDIQLFIFEFFFYFWSSSLQALVILVQFLKLKFKIWGRSDHWLLRYSNFNSLRLSSDGGRFHFQLFYFCFVFWT